MNRQQSFFLVVTVVGVLVAVLMLAPFLQYLLGAALLAFVTRPLQRHLSDRVPDSVAAGLVVVLTVVVAVLPLLLAMVAVADDASRLATGVSLERLPTVDELESLIESYTGRSIDLERRLRSGLRAAANWAASSVTGVLGAAIDVVIGVSLMLVVQFYAVRDWERFAAWTRGFDLLPTEVQDRVYGHTARATWSVVRGHVLVAILQALAAGIGLWLAGVPSVFFWTFLMAILGFIPMIGTALVWAPAGVYLVVTGSPVPGIALLVYGGVLVGALDNLARPLLIDEAVDLNDAFVLLGVIGGVSLFGAIGIFVGPVVFAVLGELLDVYRETYDRLDSTGENRTLSSYVESE